MSEEKMENKNAEQNMATKDKQQPGAESGQKECQGGEGKGHEQCSHGNGQSQSGGKQDGQLVSESKQEGVREDKGTGYYPLSDMQFDVVTLIYEKSKALQAYDKYLLDCQPCEELRSLVECIRNDDKKHVEKLKEALGKALSKSENK